MVFIYLKSKRIYVTVMTPLAKVVLAHLTIYGIAITSLQMEQVNIFKVNDVVSQLHKMDMLPDNELTRLTGEQEQTMIEKLTKPIKFRSEPKCGDL